MRRVGMVLVALILAAEAPAHAQVCDAVLEGLVSTAVTKHQKAGDWHYGLIVGAVVPGCSGVYYFGQAAPDGALPNANTAFRVGSLTKVFTSTLLSILANLGVVHVPYCSGSGPSTSLQTALDAYSPGRFTLGGWRGGAHGITLEELADHHSGLPRKPTRDVTGVDDLFTSLGQGGADVTTRADTDSVVAGECPDQISCGLTPDPSMASCGLPASCFAFASPVGAPYEYSNYAFATLGQVLAHAYFGSSWFDALNAWVLSPLGMTHTFVDGQTTTAVRGKAVAGCTSSTSLAGCTLVDGTGLEPFPAPANPAGGLWTTGPDMLVFLRYIMGFSNNNGTYVEQPAIQALAQCPRTTEAPASPTVQLGLGWAIESWHGDTFVSKNGTWGGFNSRVGYLKTAGVGLFILNNGDDDVDSTYDDLIQSL